MMKNVVKTLQKTVPYPVINITYKSKSGIITCEKNLHNQLEILHLQKYRRVHFFCFIMGGYVLSRVLEKQPIPNLGRVILDRSPFQEDVSIEAQIFFSEPVVKMFFGQTVIDIGTMNYQHINANDVGLLIETKPGILSRFLHNWRIVHKATGKLLSFKASGILCKYEDAAYIQLSHTAMYFKINSYAELIKNFIIAGRFFDLEKKQSPPDDMVFYGVNRMTISGQ